MSSSTGPAQRGSASSDPAELRRDIEEVRDELADTVNALAGKADVKSRAQDKKQELKARAIEKARQVRAQAAAKGPQLTELAQQKVQQAQRVVKAKPGAAVGGALAVLGLLILRSRRHRRRRGR